MVEVISMIIKLVNMEKTDKRTNPGIAVLRKSV